MLRQQFGEKWRESQGKSGRKERRSRRVKVLLVGGPKHDTEMHVRRNQREIVIRNGHTDTMRYRRVCKNDRGMWVFEYVEPRARRA